MIDLTYKWTNHMPTSVNMSYHLSMHEGTFVKNMLKLDNIISEFENAAMTLQKFDLAKNLNRMHRLIVRDIVNTESLYIK